MILLADKTFKRILWAKLGMECYVLGREKYYVSSCSDRCDAFSASSMDFVINSRHMLSPSKSCI